MIMMKVTRWVKKRAERVAARGMAEVGFWVLANLKVKRKAKGIQVQAMMRPKWPASMWLPRLFGYVR